MTTMTEILNEHATLSTGNDIPAGIHVACSCDWNYRTHADHAAHVAAALETAGFGLVEGEKEWGIRRAQDSACYSEEEARRQMAQQTKRKLNPTLISRTVTAWKKEA